MSLLSTMGYVPDSEVAAILAVDPRTLANWRARGSGPPYCRVGNVLLYPLDKLQDWIAASVVTPAPNAVMPELTEITPRRAGRPRKLELSASRAQAGFANVMLVLMICIVAIVLFVMLAGMWPYIGALIPGIGAALAVVVPVRVGGLADEKVDPVNEAIAGERAALRVLRRIRDNVGHGDELLGELRDVIHDDGGHVEATPRLRAFLRTLSKAIESRQ
jgi:hypothetical protein